MRLSNDVEPTFDVCVWSATVCLSSPPGLKQYCHMEYISQTDI